MSLSFKQYTSLSLILTAALLSASLLSAWSGPTATAPAGNVAAPINVGTTDQVKDAGISVNSLAVFGSQYIENKLGIGWTNPVVALDVAGTIRIGNGGEVCQSVTEGAMRYNGSSKEVEYCNGVEWIAPTSGGLQCTMLPIGNNWYNGPGSLGGSNSGTEEECLAAGQAVNATVIEYSSGGNAPNCKYGSDSMTSVMCSQYACGCSTGNCWPNTKVYSCLYN